MTLGRIGWALANSGQLDDARNEYELAIAKLRVFNLYPEMAVAFSALALVHEKAHRYDDAALNIANALDMRAQALGLAVDHNTGLARIGVPRHKLTSLMSTYPLDRDADSDKLPDLFEAAVGLNPKARDTNHNGVDDGDEDHDGDGLSNELEFGLTLNPTQLIAHHGAVDPGWLGFQQTESRGFLGHPVDAGTTGASWNIAGTGITQYCTPLSPLQAKRAYAHGWTLAARGVLHTGAAFTFFDVGLDAPRFDLYWYAGSPRGLVVRLNTGVVPWSGIDDAGSTTERWPLTQLDYDPSRKTATLRINGVPQALEQYFGHPQFRENYGLCFGGHDDFGKVASDNIDFALAMLVIR